MKKVAIIPPGTLPMPPVQGGAVENLIANLAHYNAKNSKVRFVVFSIENIAARRDARSYQNCQFKYMTIPKWIKYLDRITYFLASLLLDKDRASSFRYLWQRVSYIQQVSKDLSVNDYDRIVLENHTSLYWCLRLRHNDQKYMNRFYYHMHNKIKSFYGCQKIFLQTQKIIGVSQYILSTLPVSVQDRVDLEVLHNRIDEKAFYSVHGNCVEQLKKKLGLDQQKIVLFSGRLNAEKGIKQLLLAWRKVTVPNSVLLIVGSPYFKSGISSKFEREIQELATHLGNKVQFTGYIDYQKMPILYSMADLVVLPSMWDDPAPLTVIESVTMHKPLITTNSGGIPEYIDSNTVLLNRDKQIVQRLASAIQSKLGNSRSTSKSTIKWHFQDYYDHFLAILNIGSGE